MPEGKFIAYYRVSTQKQGVSGLGMDAQKATVKDFLRCGGELIDEFVEVETGKGPNALSKRPQLASALALCRTTGAKLLIAKLDRLARNVHFVSGLMESRVKFVACDIPEASDLTIHVMAAFAEFEAKRISERTKAGLAIARSRGVLLGVAGQNNLKRNIDARKSSAMAFALKLQPILKGLITQGFSQREILKTLNFSGITAPNGGTWGLVQLQRVLKQLSSVEI